MPCHTETLQYIHCTVTSVLYDWDCEGSRHGDVSHGMVIGRISTNPTLCPWCGSWGFHAVPCRINSFLLHQRAEVLKPSQKPNIPLQCIISICVFFSNSCCIWLLPAMVVWQLSWNITMLTNGIIVQTNLSFPHICSQVVRIRWRPDVSTNLAFVEANWPRLQHRIHRAKRERIRNLPGVGAVVEGLLWMRGKHQETGEWCLNQHSNVGM